MGRRGPGRGVTMRKPSARQPAAAPVPAEHCPRNDDCQREQARALTRIADVGEAMLAYAAAHKETFEAVGEIAKKWLKFCAFIRKWVPKLWWLPLLIGPLIGKGSDELADGLIRAATAWLTMQTGGGG